MTICLIELMLREKQIINVEEMKQASESGALSESVANDARVEEASDKAVMGGQEDKSEETVAEKAARKMAAGEIKG